MLACPSDTGTGNKVQADGESLLCQRACPYRRFRNPVTHRSAPLHCTFIRFKSTDMCLPADWLRAIFSCGGPVPLQCLGCVNGKIKHANLTSPEPGPGKLLHVHVSVKQVPCLCRVGAARTERGPLWVPPPGGFTTQTLGTLAGTSCVNCLTWEKTTNNQTAVKNL